jgi:hypothetical protein
MKRRASTPRPLAAAVAAVAASLVVLAVAVAVAAASPPPNASSAKPLPNRLPACERQCAAAVAACRAAKKANKTDSQAIRDMTASFGCGPIAALANNPNAPLVCKDLALVLLDLLDYERSVYNSAAGGVPDDRVAVFVDNGAGGKTPCVACPGRQEGCDLFAQVCPPFCLNDRRPAEEWQLVRGKKEAGVSVEASVAINGRVSNLPLGANRTVLLSKASLNTIDARAFQLGLSAVEVVHTARAQGARTAVHYHSSTAVSCVLEGCATVTMPDVDRARFCATEDGVPACYLMAPYTMVLNENLGPGKLRVLDFFSLQPREATFYSLEQPKAGDRAATEALSP